MKRVLVGVVVALAGVGAVDLLGDLTQTRPDPPRTASMEIVFDVTTRNPNRPALQAAQGVWGACQATIERRAGAADVVVNGHRARVVVQPALGRHGRQRLEGCLEDFTIDRTRARVVRMQEL